MKERGIERDAEVSFSNPVRQSLFVHDDAVKGRPKAQAAAEEIQRIIPDARLRC